jgi:hypothetical protein
MQLFSSNKMRTDDTTRDDVGLGQVRLGWMRREACAIALSQLHLINLGPSLVDITECLCARCMACDTSPANLISSGIFLAAPFQKQFKITPYKFGI